METDATIILFGGPGSERLVSVASAQNIARNRDGQWWFWSGAGEIYFVAKEALLAHEHAFTDEFTPTGAPRYPSLQTALDGEGERLSASVFLLALHGDSGEDGTVQGWFESRNLAFTGSGSTASALAFDKPRAKDVAHANAIRTAASRIIDTRDGSVLDAVSDAFAALRAIVIKPTNSGSSDGLFMVSSRAEAEAAARALTERPPGRYLIEERIVGREITVGVVERPSGLIGLPCSEVRLPAGGAFDYAGKYLGQSEEITPATISESLTREAQHIAQTMHQKIGCRGYSRTDLMLDADGFVFLEINTLPGLSKASFIPQQLQAAGIPFGEFLAEQCAIARASRSQPGNRT